MVQFFTKRETKEETNLDVYSEGLVHVTNDTSIDGNPQKHYITSKTSRAMHANL